MVIIYIVSGWDEIKRATRTVSVATKFRGSWLFLKEY